MSRFWSDQVHGLAPYVPGEQPKSSRLIKLNTNENPYPPSPRAVAVLEGSLGPGLRRYPDPASSSLRTAAGARQGLATEQVFAGNGSDEVLALAFAAFFQQRGGRVDPLLFPDISYSFYPVWASFFRTEYATVPLSDDLTLDLSPYREGRGAILFPNPNAPTAMALSLGEIEALLADVPDRLVVVDEAYVEFGAESAAPLVSRFENLLVVHTLSKSHALAGLRIGFAYGHPDLIEGLERVKGSFNSYPIDVIAERVAVEALADEAYFTECRDRIVATRDRSAARLGDLGFVVLPSRANFLFIRHPKVAARQLFDSLRAGGILVRHFAQPRVEDYLRVTIGTDDEMEALVSTLEPLLPRA